MRPKVKTDAHRTGHLSELVCSNSFRSDDSVYNAVGLLHEELRLSNSLIMEAADRNQVPAGSALAVDRDMFSKYIDTKIKSNKYIKVINKEITSLKIFKDDIVVIALLIKTKNDYLITNQQQSLLMLFGQIIFLGPGQFVQFDRNIFFQMHILFP